MNIITFRTRQEPVFACKTPHATQYPCIYNTKYTLFIERQTLAHLVRISQKVLDSEDYQVVCAQLVVPGGSVSPYAHRQTLETT